MRIIKLSAKILLWTLVFVGILLACVILYFSTVSGKRFLKNKIESYLTKKLQTRITISSLDYTFPDNIILHQIYLEDQHHDTLLHGGQLEVNIALAKLLVGDIDISKIGLKNTQIHLKRTEFDSVFNYQFVVNAFAPAKTDKIVVKDTNALKLMLRNIQLDHVSFQMEDQFGGTGIHASVDSFNAHFKRFQADKFQFELDELHAGHIDVSMTTYKHIVSRVRKDTSSIPLMLAISNMKVNHIMVNIQDEVNQFQSFSNIESIALQNASLNMLQNLIELKSISLANSSFMLKDAVSDKRIVKDSSIEMKNNWKVKVDKLAFDALQFIRNNENIQAIDGFDINHMNVSDVSILAEALYYSSDSVHAMINQVVAHEQSGIGIDTMHANIVFNQQHLNVDQLYLKTTRSLLQQSIRLSVADMNKPLLNPEKSKLLLQVKESIIAMNDLYLLFPSLNKTMAKANYQHTLFYLNTSIQGNLKQLHIPAFHLRHDGGTDLVANADITNVTDKKNIQVILNLLPSKVSKNDLSNFVVLTPEAKAQLPVLIDISSNIKGTMNDVFADIKISAAEVLLNAKVILNNLTHPAQLAYTADIQQSRVNKAMMLAFIPSASMPTSIELPTTLTLVGKLKGDRSNIESDIILDGSYGIITINGFVRQFNLPEKSQYNLTLSSRNFDLGKLLRNDSVLQTVSMRSVIQGRGFNPKTMNSTMQADIQSLGMKQYNYENIHLNSSFNQGNIISDVISNDPNLVLQSHSTLRFNGSSLSGDISLHLDTAQLHKLHLTNDTINIAMQSVLHIDELNAVNQLGIYRADSIKMDIRNEHVLLDSLIVLSVDSNETHYVSLLSPFATINANGHFQLNQIGPAVINYLNGYVHVLKDTAHISPQQITYEGIVRGHPLLKLLIPGVVKMDTLSFNGRFDSERKDSAFAFNLSAPFLQYQDKILFRSRVNIVDNNLQQLQFNIGADTIQSAGKRFYQTSAVGYATHDSVSIDVDTRNSKDKNRFMIGAIMTLQGNEYGFHLKDKLILNDQDWVVAPENTIVYGSKGIMVNQFNLSNQQSFISAQSKEQKLNSPIELKVTNFSIGTITSLLNKDTMLASGLMNANVTISEFDKKLPAFVGTMKIEELFYHQQAIGNINFNATKVNDQTIHAELDLSEHENDVHLTGNYFLNHTDKQFDAELQIKHLKMSSIEPFTGKQISDGKGSIEGNIQLSGKLKEPQWNGQLTLIDPEFRFTKIGTKYHLKQQSILFRYPDIVLNHFMISDSLNHTMTIDGTLHSKTISQYDLNLDVNSIDFIVVNTPKNTNDFIYGYAAVNTDIHLGGNTLAPDIDGSIHFNDQTDATILLPEKNVSKEAARSVVRFIDRDTFDLPEKILFVPEGPEGSNLKSYINYNLNIDVSPKALLTVIIDPSTGDELEVKGDAKLAVGVDPGGNILLAGNYNLNDGHYILHYQFLKREFKLLSGSTVAFGGDPLDAHVNIQAVYYANTSAIDLVGNELGDADSRTVNTFNQKIPFKVLLYLKGTLKKLDISFDIQMPDENKGLSNLIVTTVENKLTQLRADPSAINKQVFSLLVLNRFVGEQSTDFFKSNGSGVNDIARESVSKFLSAALDQIASDLIKGINIDLNLNSYKDYRSGDQEQRTDLNIGVSKRFMDDRLTISVGKNLGVEGQDKSAKARQQNTASYMPDATINYKLSKDGRYMIRAYTKNKFEVILDGYIVETGLSFIVTMDYEKFNEMFTRKPKIKKG